MVKQLHAFIAWLLYTSLFAALCALMLCMATESLLLRVLSPFITPLHGYVIGCTLVVYNAHFLIRKNIFTKQDATDRQDWSVRNRQWHFIVCGVGVMLAGVSLLHLSWEIIIASIVLGMLSFMYTLPLLPLGRRLRDWGLVKIFTLTAVWTITTAILPMLYWKQTISNYPMEIAMRFVFMFSLCVAFDIRDSRTDAISGIVTVPNLVGIQRSKKIINAAIVLFLLLAIVQYKRYSVENRLLAEVLTTIASGYILNKAGGDRSDIFYLGLVDGLMLLNGLLVVVLS